LIYPKYLTYLIYLILCRED